MKIPKTPTCPCVFHSFIQIYENKNKPRAEVSVYVCGTLHHKGETAFSEGEIHNHKGMFNVVRWHGNHVQIQTSCGV